MRRWLILLCILAVCLTAAVTVMGASNASRVQIYATVQQNESCSVTINATLFFDAAAEHVRFPVPLEATAVSLNGSRVWTSRDDQSQYVNLDSIARNMDFSVTISYLLPDVIHTGAANQPQLELPLLSGFEFPISQLEFSVNLPVAVAAKPAFSSGYHQANIEKDLTSTVRDNTITGRSTIELKDHESLTMTLPVDEAMFPDAPLVFYESDADDIAMLICAIAALLYWLFFLRCLPVVHQTTASVPEGITAGQLNAVMTLGNADLSLMVLSWAQLGYVQLQRKSKGQILIIKQMDMGNERTEFEQYCFRILLGKRDVVDTTGSFYAICCRKIAGISPKVHSFIHKRCGNPRLMRSLVALIALFGGVSFGIAISQGAALQGFWVFVSAVFGLALGWFTQDAVRELFLRKSIRTLRGCIASFVFLIFGLLAGQFNLAVGILLLQWLGALMTFFGGRRTPAGRQEFARILGLRRYLKTVTREDLDRIDAIDAEYFHTMAPYALALGVDRHFARRFGIDRVPPCPYLITNLQPNTAAQWDDLLRKTLADMNRRSRILPLEKLIAFTSALKPNFPKKRKRP